LDDIAELKPTVFCSVPRLWNRIYDKVNMAGWCWLTLSNPH
jgi:long-subunit acyl-CoA synthetase (AMP-forming)